MIEYAYTCHRGLTREDNEDNFWCRGRILEEGTTDLQEIRAGRVHQMHVPCFAVFDGMGGASGRGTEASRLAAQTFGECYKMLDRKRTQVPMKRFMESACGVLNQFLYENDLKSSEEDRPEIDSGSVSEVHPEVGSEAISEDRPETGSEAVSEVHPKVGSEAASKDRPEAVLSARSERDRKKKKEDYSESGSAHSGSENRSEEKLNNDQEKEAVSDSEHHSTDASNNLSENDSEKNNPENASNAPSPFGCTGAFLGFWQDYACACNVGDSRVYLNADRKTVRLSVDHTSKETDANGKKKLTQYFGMDKDPHVLKPDIVRGRCHKEDVYLLCSNGLTDAVSEREIGRILTQQEDPALCVRELLRAALAKKKSENITIIVCRVD